MALFTNKPWLTIKAMRIHSLKVRLMLSALVMLLVLIPVVGITLNSAFDQQLKIAIQNELKAYSYSILGVAEVVDNQLLMPEQLLENQFNVIQSGLYALITTKGLAEKYSGAQPASSTKVEPELEESPNSALWQSRSFLSITLPKDLSSPLIGQSSFSEVIIENKAHLAYSFSASFSVNQQDFPITLHVIKEQSEYLILVNEFKQKVWTWLLILLCIFILVQIVWLAWTLKPLTKLSDELTAVEQGKQTLLTANYPQELEQVTKQLNVLLHTEQQQRKRYRNALADLAHSLKTPLAVMQTQAELSTESLDQLHLMNNMIEHQLKRAQSAGESSWHLGIAVDAVVDKLLKTLAKIYHSKQLSFSCDISPSAIFKGDEADLMEILGNLLDNACKAANQKVIISAKCLGKKLVITIEDDGEGIDAAQQDDILLRGVRADTYQKGHGIGLAIVRDLVASYQGGLAIERSKQLHGALFILTFAIL